jgi:alkylhydroperoxidase family enzyme
MTWVRTCGKQSANVLDSHSLNPGALRAHLGLYRTIMFGQPGLSRVEREAIAVVVSAANGCHY